MGGRGPAGRVAAAVAAAALLVIPAAGARSSFDGRALDKRLRAEQGVLAVLVERDHRLLFERYYNGSAPAARLDTFSVTKSVTSTLVGIALGAHKLRSLDEHLAAFFPSRVAAARDRRVHEITLRQLLTMTSGYRDTLVARSEDWVRTLVDRPLAEAPGRSFSYDNGSYHLLSAVLTKATGATAESYGRRVLFGPLGIATVHWSDDGQGHSLGNTGLRLTARDLLRIGELFLQHGKYNGRQLVPASYAAAATAAHVSVGGGAYGYGWWVLDGRSPRGFSALGYGGQAIAVFPALRAVAVVQGSGANIQRVLFQDIVGALLGR